MRTFASLAVATLLWLLILPRLYRDDPAQLGEALERRQLSLWSDPVERGRLRAANPEWDFMGRAFVSWSMANLARSDPSQRAACLEVMDAVISQTLDEEARLGPAHFLMPYGSEVKQSLFIDGEIALMLGLRRQVEEKPSYQPLFAARVEKMAKAMRASPLYSAESYPDECWT